MKDLSERDKPERCFFPLYFQIDLWCQSTNWPERYQTSVRYTYGNIQIHVLVYYICPHALKGFGLNWIFSRRNTAGLITELETYTQSIPKTWKNVFLSLMRGDVTVGQFSLWFSTLLPERNRPEHFSSYPKISPNPSASLSVIFGCSVLRQLSAESKRVGFLWSLLSAGFY